MNNERSYPSSLLKESVEALCSLPGVGERTALGYSLFLLQRPVEVSRRLAEGLLRLREGVRFCSRCGGLTDGGELCGVCSNVRRRQGLVTVVENIQMQMALEGTGQYDGVYHVLGGLISPMAGVGPSDLRIESLVARVESGGVDEVCLALSPTMEGDMTGLFIGKRLKASGVKVTRIARGVVPGEGLLFQDGMTLARSIEERTLFSL